MSPPPEPALIAIPTFNDDRGSLLVVDWEDLVPFTPRRFYCIHTPVSGARRAGHAHWKDQELMVALHGSFTVLTDNGQTRREHRLDRPDRAIYVPALVWHELHRFSEDAVCAVLASERYSKADYCRDYEQFLDARRL